MGDAVRPLRGKDRLAMTSCFTGWVAKARWCAALALATSCAGGAPAGPGEGSQSAGLGSFGRVWVMVNADGSFTPSRLTVTAGTEVVWAFADHTDTIIPVTGSSTTVPQGCKSVKPYEPGGFAGPARAPTGIFTLGPNPKGAGYGLVERTGSCGADEDRGNVGDLHLCRAGTPGATMASTWSDPAISGVFIRMSWADVNPGLGVYDFTALEREVKAAVAHGKTYTIAFEAGKEGTPEWLFTSGLVSVPRVPLWDPSPTGTCGPEMSLGAPWASNYKARYFELLRAVAAHLKTRASWYQALAAVKLSGANLFTAENRLPRGCVNPACCNDESWSQNGYLPSRLTGFYAEQLDVIADAFPGKPMSYALIQAGFPRINDQGGYVDASGVLTAGEVQEDAHAQTEAIISDKVPRYPSLFTVQHNGLQPLPAGVACARVKNDDSPLKKAASTAGSGKAQRRSRGWNFAAQSFSGVAK